MYPDSIHFGPNVPILGPTLRPKYILFGYMGPYGLGFAVLGVRFQRL